MKKIIWTLLGLASFVSFSFAANLTVNNVSTINNSCNPSESEDVYYYISNTLTRNPYDIFGNVTDSLISKTSTVDLWRNNGILTNCTDWRRVSNVTVANDPNGALAIQNYDGCVFNKPTLPKHNDPNRIDAQIHYNVAYALIGNLYFNSINDKFYHRDLTQNTWTCYPNNNVVSSYNSCSNVTVKYSQMYYHTGECLNYKIFWCGDGLLNRPGGSTTYHNGNFSEQCDPNDPNQQGWGNVGCSPTCQPINVQAPSCSLNAVQVSTGVYNVNWNIIGQFPPTHISLTPPLANPSIFAVSTNNGTWSNLTPTGYGNFTVSMTVSNSGGSYTCSDTFNIPQPQISICGDGKIDWPNSNGVYEECDNGPSFGSGCNTQCKLMTPSCSLTTNVTSQLIGHPIVFSANKDIWARYYSFNLGNTIGANPNILYTGAIVFPYSYVYPNVGAYSQSLLVENNHMPIATGVTRPTAICNTQINVLSGCKIEIDPVSITLGDTAKVSWTIWPDFNIPANMYVSPVLVGPWPHNIYAKTGDVFVGPNINNTGTYTFSINAWTINGVPFSCTGLLDVSSAPLGKLEINKILLSTGNLSAGDFVDYVIELQNVGSGIFNNVFMNDILPPSLNLISHSVTGILTYTDAQWQNNLGNWIVEYSGFNLLPGQKIFFNIRGQVKTGASLNQTTNCAFTSGDHDCVIYNLAPKPYLLKSQKMSNVSVNTTFTTGVINVNPGDYITYRLDFQNIGGGNTSGGVRIVDHMPLCVDYVSANMYGVSNVNFTQTQDINGRWILEYNGFDLLAGQSAYVIITGQIMNTVNCMNQNTYLNNSYLYFHNPLNVINSNTTALKANKSIVNITKDSDVHSHFPGEDKNFEIKLTNYGPNPISNIILQDVRPSFNNCITYLDWTGSLGMTKNPNSFVWNFPGLGVGDSINLYISGSIVNSPSCVKPDYENIINLTYTELGIQHQDQDKYYFEVKPTPVANISLIKTVDKSIVKSGDNLTYTVVYQNMGNTPLLNYTIVDYWPAMVNFISAIPFPSNILNFNTGSVLTWTFNSQLLPGQTGQIVLQGIVK